MIPITRYEHIDMRKKLTPSEQKFVEFLELVNAIDAKAKDGYALKTLESNRRGFQDWPKEPFELIKTLLKELNEALEYAFETKRDKAKFCTFLVGQSSLSHLGSNADEIDGFSAAIMAAAAYNLFQKNYILFKQYLSNRTVPITLLETDLNVRVKIVQDEDMNIEIELNPDSVFYGFREFSRVLPCKRCGKYFYSTRLGSEANSKLYCSTECGNAARYETLKEKKETEKGAKNNGDL